MSSPQKSISHPCRGANVAGVYNDPLNSIPSKIHLRAMSPGPQTSYGGGYKSRSPMTSAHAATLFNVKSETDESHSNDKKAQTPLELYLSDIIAVDIMPDPAAVDVNLMYITTKTIGFLQLAFHKLLDQEILLAFFKASLSEGVISRHDDRLQKLACTKTVESQVNMDNFTARAVKGRFLNESLWERTKRRMARYATKASEGTFVLFQGPIQILHQSLILVFVLFQCVHVVIFMNNTPMKRSWRLIVLMGKQFKRKWSSMTLTLVSAFLRVQATTRKLQLA
jgi:hypothetical protein